MIKDPEDIEAIELDLFIEAIKRFSGYDLSGYAKASLKRRIQHHLINEGLHSISELIPILANQPSTRKYTLDSITVNVSELFRDPDVFLSIKKNIFPYLETFPKLDIWVAGCANGEEAFSLAIMLEEAKLLDRTHIHATDISSLALQQARSGILTHSMTKSDAQRYRESGGECSLSQYFSSAYGTEKISQHLLDRISFYEHNLVQESVFCSAQLVICRNVMIYFNRETQDKVLQLLGDSLTDCGFLIIGLKESLEQSTALFYKLTTINKTLRIYQKKN